MKPINIILLLSLTFSAILSCISNPFVFPVTAFVVGLIYLVDIFLGDHQQLKFDAFTNDQTKKFESLVNEVNIAVKDMNERISKADDEMSKIKMTQGFKSVR
jgi:hypothetical protein